MVRRIYKCKCTDILSMLWCLLTAEKKLWHTVEQLVSLWLALVSLIPGRTFDTIFPHQISCYQSAFLKLCFKNCFWEDIYWLSYRHSLIMLISNSWVFILTVLSLIIYWFSKDYLVQDSLESFNVFIYSGTTRPGFCFQNCVRAFGVSIDMWCS